MKSLGERYMWVDCLCIMQDDEGEKFQIIPRMDSVFGFASVTIVAALGINVEAGLPGIEPESRFPDQIPFSVNGVSLLATPDPAHLGDSEVSDLDDSTWFSRGWTLQEKLFSGRALIFTKEQVYWECQKATWCEDGLWETTKSQTIYRHSFYEKDFRHSWETDVDSFERIYRKLVERYSGRALSFASDGSHAFRGVLHHFYMHCDQNFIWGLPENFLSSALTRPCDSSVVKRRLDCCSERSPGGIITLYPFPSWAWVGWVGMVYYETLLRTLNSETVDLIFYYLDPNGMPTMLDSATDTLSLTEIDVRKENDMTIVTRKDIPDCVLSCSIASNTLWFLSSSTTLQFRHQVLCFWSSAAILYVRHGVNLDGDYEPSLSHNGKVVDTGEWPHKPLFPPGYGDLAEFVVVASDSTFRYEKHLALHPLNGRTSWHIGGDWCTSNSRIGSGLTIESGNWLFLGETSSKQLSPICWGFKSLLGHCSLVALIPSH